MIIVDIKHLHLPRDRRPNSQNKRLLPLGDCIVTIVLDCPVIGDLSRLFMTIVANCFSLSTNSKAMEIDQVWLLF